MGRNSVSFSESTPRSSFTPSSAAPYSILASSFCNGLFLALKQLLGGLPPSAKVVFVKHHEIPVHRVQPLVPRFYISGRVATEEVLKGAEVDDRLVVVDFGGIAVGIAGEIVPAFKVDMGFEIGLPCVFHRRLEGQREHPLGAELPSELIRREGLSKAHLCVPKEARDGVLILRPDRVKIIEGLVDRLGLFKTHRKRLVMRAGNPLGEMRVSRTTRHWLAATREIFKWHVSSDE